MAKAYIGCSGYNYRHWRKGVFYPDGLVQRKEFEYYASKFNTVEINSTFYSYPLLSTWEKWRDRAQNGFVQTVKVNKLMTRYKRLLNIEEPWNEFAHGAMTLGKSLGPFLFQLPPSFSINVDRLNSLSKILPTNQRFAFEFRHMSWFCDEVYKVMRKNNWAIVVNSYPGLETVFEVTADFTYLRFHGVPILYTSLYSDKELQPIVDFAKKQIMSGVDVYGYFNNDTFGNAPKNANRLNELIHS